MTAIACWISKERGDDLLFMVGDSVVSDPNGIPFTTKCAKIFAIPVVCRPIAVDPNLTPAVDYYRPVGFAYAGSSLIGLNAAASLASIFATFTRHDPMVALPPSMEELAEIARHVFFRIALDIGSSTPGSPAPRSSEAALCGYCEPHRRFEMYHFQPTVDPKPFDIHIAQVSTNAVLLLGEKKSEIEKEISDLRAKDPERGIAWHRAPQSVIKNTIRNGQYKTIGGHLQVAMDRGRGMQLFSTMEPVVFGKPQARLVLQGFDLQEVPVPAGYITGSIGMA